MVVANIINDPTVYIRGLGTSVALMGVVCYRLRSLPFVLFITILVFPPMQSSHKSVFTQPSCVGFFIYSVVSKRMLCWNRRGHVIF